MRVLFDTNVVLDVLLKRQPYEAAARWLFNEVEKGTLQGFLGATTVTTTYYVAGRAIGEEKTRRDLEQLFRMFEIAPVGRATLEEALTNGFSDYEDSVLHEAGQRAGVEAIVTRNVRDFEKAALPIYTPEQLRAALEVD